MTTQKQAPVPAERAALRERAAQFLNNAQARHKRDASSTSPSGRPVLTRDALVGERGYFKRAGEVGNVNIEARTVELAFSSEVEVQQWFGIEILSHEPGACDLSRLNDGGALLVGHDWGDQIGVVERASIDSDKRGRATVRFGRSARAEEIFQDVQDGIRRHVSVGYRVQEWKLVGERDGVDIYLITKWEPYEISHVPIPADPTVGVGRALPVATRNTEPPKAAPSITTQTTNQRQESSVEKIVMHNGALVRALVNDAGEVLQVLETLQTAEQIRSATVPAQAPATGAATPTGPPAGVSAVEAERSRTRTINAIAEQFGAQDLARTFVDNGQSVDAFRAVLLERQRSVSRPVSESRDLGLSDSDLSNFSIVRLIQAVANPHDQAAQRAAGKELEIGRAAAQRDGKEARGAYVPFEVLAHRAVPDGFSISGAGATGGNAVATELRTGSFIELLRNRCLLMQYATPLAGLAGNLEIPRQSAGAGGYWVGEGVPVGNTKGALDKVALSPKTVGGRTPITRKMLLQSAMAIESLVRSDLANAIAEAIDKKAFYGDGTADTPLGIFNTPGINMVPFAGDVPTFAELVEMESKVASKNADVDAMRYITNAAMRGALKTSPKFDGGETPIWTGGRSSGEVNGYGAEVTNQIDAGDVFFGNFADVLLGLWGGLDIITDPYSDAGAGGIIVTALQDVDVALRRGASFAYGTKATV
ncbi:phage major capsid protein [Aquabacterium sp.]|uniref:phage major capsid protein n=1 Tax=Aquabacterium sp. TaxID=1872578 RepID=UPI003BAEF620